MRGRKLMGSVVEIVKEVASELGIEDGDIIEGYTYVMYKWVQEEVIRIVKVSSARGIIKTQYIGIFPSDSGKEVVSDWINSEEVEEGDTDALKQIVTEAFQITKGIER